MRSRELACRRFVERRRRWNLISTNKEHTDKTKLSLQIDRRGSVFGFGSLNFGGQNEKSAWYSSIDSSSSDITFLCSILDTNSSCLGQKWENAVENYHLNGYKTMSPVRHFLAFEWWTRSSNVPNYFPRPFGDTNRIYVKKMLRAKQSLQTRWNHNAPIGRITTSKCKLSYRIQIGASISWLLLWHYS